MSSIKTFDNIDELFAEMQSRTQHNDAAIQDRQRALIPGDWFLIIGGEPGLVVIGVLHGSSYAEDREAEANQPNRAMCKDFSTMTHPEGDLEVVHRCFMHPITQAKAEVIYKNIMQDVEARLPDFPIWSQEGVKYESWRDYQEVSDE